MLAPTSYTFTYASTSALNGLNYSKLIQYNPVILHIPYVTIHSVPLKLIALKPARSRHFSDETEVAVCQVELCEFPTVFLHRQIITSVKVADWTSVHKHGSRD